METQKTDSSYITGTSRIPRTNPQVDHYGRKILFAILGPIAVLLTLLLMSAFASPAAVLTSFLPDHGRETQQQRAAFRDIAASVEEATKGTVPLGNSFAKKALENGCFTNMDYADNEKLDRCGRLVYMALSEVQRRQTESASSGITTLATYPDLIPNLRLAAIEACRESWARGKDASLRSPTCSVAELTLARRD